MLTKSRFEFQIKIHRLGLDVFILLCKQCKLFVMKLLLIKRVLKKCCLINMFMPDFKKIFKRNNA